MKSEVTVGKIRQQTAKAGADERVVLVTKDPELSRVLRRYRVVDCYPDTRDELGNWIGVFKIEVEEIE